VTPCVNDTTEFEAVCTKNEALVPISFTDPSCSFGAPATLPPSVVKCDEELGPGECYTLTLTIAGETNSIGVGPGVAIDKAATECIEGCIAGPTCGSCVNGTTGDEDPCLTRTLGFWGTHPAITSMYIADDLTVCGAHINTAGEVVAGKVPCDGAEQALCINAKDCPSSPPFLVMVAQLTAAKLNLQATAELLDATCSDWQFDSKSIEEWIGDCEMLCDASRNAIANSGCIQALDAFNNEVDILSDNLTPFPFNRPGPADIVACNIARGDRLSIPGANGCGGAC